MILNQVRQIRAKQPRVGGRKLYLAISKQGTKIGRDRLFKLLRERDMLVKRRRRYRTTTQSRHRFWVYRNLIKETLPNGPNQQYVSDITYLETEEGFCYLSLVTDRYSRKIVGYGLSRDLTVEGCLQAAKMALREAGTKAGGLIHHSDRGIQYCCNPYVSMMEKSGVRMSMTEKDHVYENAMAERVNGILKDEFLLGSRLRSFEEANQLVNQAVRTYNEDRLHGSIGYKTPSNVHENN